MALFISAQSGNWHDPLTWDVGAVPNLGTDDVIVADGHEVLFESGYYESLGPGHLLGIAANGTLRIQGGIDAYDSTVFVMGSLIAEGSHLAIWGGANLQIDPGATVIVTSSFYLEWESTADVEGQLTIESGGYADVYDGGMLSVEVGGTVQNYGYCYCEYGGAVVAHDNFSIETGGYPDVFDYPSVTIENNGRGF